MTAAEIIDALGGVAVVARALGVRGNVVTNWKRQGIPRRSWKPMFQLAEERTRLLASITMTTFETHTHPGSP